MLPSEHAQTDAARLEYLKGLGQQYGKLGGKKAAKNLTAEERSARAKIAWTARRTLATDEGIAGVAKPLSGAAAAGSAS